MDEIVSRFSEIRQGLRAEQLRAVDVNRDGSGKQRADEKARQAAETELERQREENRRNLLSLLDDASDPTPGALSGLEPWWRDHFEWLKEKGYQLRPRYAPDWIPSWQGTDKSWIRREDAQVPLISYILDATRTSDGSFVMLKMLKKSIHPHEVEIVQLFSSEPLASDPANHTVPIYDVLQVPEDDDQCILVMPLLRVFFDPRFDTFGEAIACFSQLFEGLQFMHKQHVAHRDCMVMNIMMDAKNIYPDSFHPSMRQKRRDFQGNARYLTRTQRPPKYYFIDFGISRRYDASDDNPLEEQIMGGDRTVPEFQKSLEPCNPFPTDVYYLGNVIRQKFVQEHYGFEFIIPLVGDMVQDDPFKRPNMDEVVARFDEIRRRLSDCKLRSRVVRRDDNGLLGLFRAIAHWNRRIRFTVLRVPAVPTP